MEVCIKKKFIPQIQEENTNINTTLFVFLQIVSENAGSKKLLVNYFKRDGEGCIFDGVQDLLKSVSIELELSPMDQMSFYNLSFINDPPHLVYVDDLLDDPSISEAMVNTLPPSCFILSREVKNSDRKLHENSYFPLYKIGKGKEKLKLARWIGSWKLDHQFKSGIRKSVLVVRSESDLEEMGRSLKNSSIYQKLIIVTKYPDEFGVKEKVLQHRMDTKQEHVFVVFSNSDVDEKAMQERIKGGLVCNIFNDGTWGGEYYVPALTSN